jgi:DNA-binding beta-propeller fold protein YncE
MGIKVPFRCLALVIVAAAARPTLAHPTLTLPIGWMGDIVSDGTDIYVTTMAGARPIYRINRLTGEILAVLEESPFVVGNPRGAAFDGVDRLFVTAMSPKVCELTTGGSLVQCFTVDVDPFPNATDGFRTGAIAFDGTNLYVGDVDAGTILVTDRSGVVIRYFDSGMRPDGMVFDATTGHLWVVDIFLSDRLSEITTDGTLVRQCSVPYEPGIFGLGGIALVGSKFYVAEPLNPAEPADGTTLRAIQRNSLKCDPPFHPGKVVISEPGPIPMELF